jgi:beta-lactamase superfamily II metal-dependent hydrolase
MKIVIFDVDNAACALVVSPNGYGMMIDCGCAAASSQKANPIEVINKYKEWLAMKPYNKLALLHITHPDDDHVRNAKRIQEELTPFQLRRTYVELFPDADSVNNEYKQLFDTPYRRPLDQKIDWGFEYYQTFQIPIDTVKADDTLRSKIRNNSSIICYIKHNGVSILFAGDLEKAGWEWLAQNNSAFVATMRQGLNILIAPHHGHKSGFPKALFELTRQVNVVIHSKGSESNIEGTDVSSQYTTNTTGIQYTALSDKQTYKGGVLTTRSNGTIFIETKNEKPLIYTEKASSNHTPL